MEAAAHAQPSPAGPVYSRRQPEKTALYQVTQKHLLTFEQQWTDQASGGTLPKFVTDELHSALNLVDHVLPDVPIRQFVLTMPFPLRFPLAFDGKLLGQVVRIFTDTVASWYRRRHLERDLPAGETGAVTVIQRANSDLRLNPHLHTVFLDGVYAPDRGSRGQMFHPAPTPTQQEIEAVVCRAGTRILRFLQRHGVITLVTAPGDGEVNVSTDATMGDKDPLLAKLLAAAAAGAEPAGPANKRKAIRIVLDPDDRPCCGQRQAWPSAVVPLPAAPAPRQRPPVPLARRRGEAGLQAPVVRWHVLRRA